jgi:hypothetical protein
MEYEDHGGLCCGAKHVFGFDQSTPADLDAFIAGHTSVQNNRLLEAILSERQVNPSPTAAAITREVREAGGWPNILRARGFRLAEMWRNSNTGRNCYRFVLIPRLLSDDPNFRPPFEWPEGEEVNVPIRRGAAPPPPVAAPAPAPVVTSTEYFAHLQRNGRRGPFETVAAAREAYPRCRRFDRRDIYSDGQFIWHIV